MSTVGSAWAVVRRRDFRRLLAVRLTGQASDGVFQVALASYVLFSPERRTSAPEIAAAFAVVLLPYSVLGPFAGVLLDRWRRRQVLVWANMLRALFAVGVAALILSGVDGAVFYVAVRSPCSASSVHPRGLSASLPHVVPTRELVPANALATTAGTLTALFGAGAGVLIRALAGGGDEGSSVVVLVTAGLYAIAGSLALRLGRDLLGPDLFETPPQAREAVRHVAQGLVDESGTSGIPTGAARARRHHCAPVRVRISTVATILLYAILQPIDDPDAVSPVRHALAASAPVSSLRPSSPRAPRDGWGRRAGSAAVRGRAIVQVVFGLPYTERGSSFGVPARIVGRDEDLRRHDRAGIGAAPIAVGVRGVRHAVHVSFVAAAVFAALCCQVGQSYTVFVRDRGMYHHAVAYGVAVRLEMPSQLSASDGSVASPSRSAAPSRHVRP